MLEHTNTTTFARRELRTRGGRAQAGHLPAAPRRGNYTYTPKLRTVVEAGPRQRNGRRTEVPGAVRHAAYPRAEATLCLEPTAELVGMRGLAARKPPTCAECDRVARLFDSIDHSAPEAWYRGC